MAQFDAGSIVGTLDLDRDPYTEGLDLARQQAEDFENRKLTATLGIADAEAKAKLDEIRAKIREISDDGVNARIGLFGNEEAQAELDSLIEKEREAAKQVDVKIDVQGAPEAVAELEGVKRAADSASGMDGGGGMSKLIMLALALAPALIPIGAVGGAGLAAFAGGVGQAVAALGPFALIAKGDFTDMTKATAALATAQKNLESATTTAQKAKAIKELADAEKTLAGPMGAAATAYGLVSAAVKKLKDDTAGPVFGVMTQAFQLAAELLPKLEPVIVASATGISSMLGIFKTAFEGPTFSKFLSLITDNIAPDLELLAHTLVNFGKGFANLIIGLDPITQRIYKWIFGISQSFANWSSDGGFAGFLGYVNREAGPVGGLIMAIWDALKNVFTVLSPFGELLLGPLTALFKVLADVNLAPLSKALGDLVVALSPLFPALGQLVNDVLPLLVPLLDAAVPLVANLANAFNDLVNDLPKWFIDTMAGLALAVWAFNLAADANPVVLLALGIALLVAALPRGLAEVLIGIAAALWLVNFALDANPIIGLAVLIAIAVAGIVYGVIEIVKHWSQIVGFFSNLWSTVYGFFKKYWAEILIVLSGGLLIAPVLIVKYWKNIEGFFSGLWQAVAGFFSRYGKEIFDVLILIALWPITLYQNWDKVTAFFSSLWTDISNGVVTGWNAVTDFISKVPGKILAFFEGAPGWLYQHGKDILGGLKTGATEGFDAVWNWLIGLPARIASAAVGMWDGLKHEFEKVINAIIHGWDWFAEKLHLHVDKFQLIPGTPLWDPVNVGPIDWNPGASLHIPDVPALADGAFVAARLGGVLAQLGEGSSDEAVVPLDRWDVTRKGEGAGFTDAQVAAIIAAIRDLPEATGHEVGSQVGDAFKSATKAQTRDLITAGRT